MKQKLLVLLTIFSMFIVGCESNEEELDCSHDTPCKSFEEHDKLISEENNYTVQESEDDDDEKDEIKDNEDDNKNDENKDKDKDQDNEGVKQTYYRVAVGSFKEKENADNVVKDLDENKIDAFVGEYLVEDKTHYRVIVGSFKEKENASNLIKEIKDLGYDAFVSTYNK